MSVKIERISSNLMKEISYILMMEVKDRNIQFVTITDCKVTSDLSYAKVYYTVLDESKKRETHESLRTASNFIRKKLFDRIELRNIPELQFIYDSSIAYGQKIEKIIEEIHEDK